MTSSRTSFRTMKQTRISTVSFELVFAFHRRLRRFENLTVDFHILVLGTAAWPLTAPTEPMHIPQELLKTYERFLGFYNNKYRWVSVISYLI